MEAANAVGDWGRAVISSVTAALSLFVAAVPHIIGFLVILLAGWFIASVVARIAATLLRRVRFNELSQRAGLSDFVQKTGVQVDSAGFLAAVVKWFVRLMVLVVAFDALGLPAVSQVLREFLLWLPNLAVAMVVLVIGGLAANAAASLVRGATASAELGNPRTLGRIAAAAVWTFTAIVAVSQLGIATTLVNALFIATVGAAAIALGLAFGLGGRDTAREIVRGWYGRNQRVSSKAHDALADAGVESRDESAGAARLEEPEANRRAPTPGGRGEQVPTTR